VYKNYDPRARIIKAAADQVIRHAWSAVRKQLGEG